MFWNIKLNTRTQHKRLQMFSVFSKYSLELTPDQTEEMTQTAKVTGKMWQWWWISTTLTAGSIQAKSRSLVNSWLTWLDIESPQRKTNKQTNHERNCSPKWSMKNKWEQVGELNGERGKGREDEHKHSLKPTLYHSRHWQCIISFVHLRTLWDARIPVWGDA